MPTNWKFYGQYTSSIGQPCGISLFCLKLSSGFVLKLTASACLISSHLIPSHNVQSPEMPFSRQSPCHHSRISQKSTYHCPDLPSHLLALPFSHFNFFVLLSEITFALFLLSLLLYECELYESRDITVFFTTFHTWHNRKCTINIRIW